MSHNILGERYRGIVPAWHGLGETFEEGKTLEAAVEEVAGDVAVHKAPLWYMDHATGKAVRLDKREAVIRRPTDDDPESRFMGFVTQNWKVRQYTDYAKLFESLADQYPVETAGLMGKGETLFFSLRGPAVDLKAPGGYTEELFHFFIGLLSQEPGTAHKIMHSPIRPVCANTCAMAEAKANINLSVPHVGDPAAEMEFVATLIGQFNTNMAKTKETFEAWMRKRFSYDDLAEVIAKTHPMPTKPRNVKMLESLHDDAKVSLLQSAKGSASLDRLLKAEEAWTTARERVETLRGNMRDLAGKFNDEHPHVANTAWAAYNAATELADWRPSKKDPSSSILFGGRQREKIRAYKAIAGLV